MDIIWEPLYAHEVKGHKSRSQVIRCQLVRQPENVKVDSLAYLRPIRTMCSQQVWDQVQVSNCIMHKPRWHTILALRFREHKVFCLIVVQCQWYQFYCVEIATVAYTIFY